MDPVDVVLTPGTETSLVTWDAGGLDVEGEYWDGTFWRTLFAAQAEAEYEWDTTSRKGPAKVRVRSVHDLGTSDWVESDEVTLAGKFSGNLWTAYGELGAQLIWKASEASGQLQDASGNARHSTTNVLAGANYSQTAIISNRAAQTAIKHGGASATPAVQRADVGAWVQGIKTMLFFMKPATYGTTDALLQLTNRLTIRYNSGSGVLSAGLPTGGIGSGSDLAWPSLPSTGATHMIATVAGGGRHANYTDGAVVASRSIASPGAVGQDVLFMAAVGGAWDVTYQGMALFDTELDALQIAWLYQVAQNTPNEPPTQPGAFTVPAAGDYDQSITVAHGASTDPEADPIGYEYERLDPDTAAWEALTLTVPLDTSEWLERDGYKLRVRALDDPYGEFSAWRESDSFDIVHAHAAPTTPAAPEWVGCSIRNLYFYAAAFASTAPGVTARAVHWQFADNADFTAPIEFTTDGRLGFLPEWLRVLSLDADTEYWARYAWEDSLGKVGAWSEGAYAKTSDEHGTGSRYIFARDESGNERHGTYGHISGVDGSSFLNHNVGSPSLRFPASLLDTDAPAHGFLTGYGDHKADWRDDADPIAYSDHWSIMLRIVPLAYGTFGLFGPGVYDSGTPLSSFNTGWIYGGGDVHLFVDLQNEITLDVVTERITLGPAPIGEMTTFLVRGATIPAQEVWVNDESVWTVPAGYTIYSGGARPPESWITVGHWGAAPNVGGPQIFRGIAVDLAVWSSNFLEGKTAAPSHAAILASENLEAYYRFNDPTLPTTPVLSGAAEE